MCRMDTLSFSSAIILLLTLTVCDGVQWSQTPADQVVVYACTGQDLTLHWNFTLAPGEQVADIRWHYTDGHSDQMIAVLTEGHILVMPTFSGRVSLHGNAGLVLDHVVPEDKGNYSVDVHTVNPLGTYANLHDRTTVEVTAPPSTISGNLTLTQSWMAVFNNDTSTWHVQLRCGHFTDRGQPPVNVVWKTPVSQSQSSTQYEGGQFFLLLDNPVVGGQYSCQLSPDSPAASSCLHGNDSISREVAVTVDEMKARLTLIEANQEGQQTKLQQQQTQLQQHKVENEELRQRNSELTQQLEQFHSHYVNLTSQVEQYHQDNANLTNWVHNLQTLINNNLTCACREQTSHSISFHAQLTSNEQITDLQTVIPNQIFTNEGGAYNSTTGKFTVPINGTYIFLANLGAQNSHAAGMNLVVDNNSISYTRSTYSGGYQGSSCHAVLHLVKGQQVWLSSYTGGTNYYEMSMTSFSGSLLFADA